MLHSVRTIRRILVLGVLLGTGTSSALASQRVLNGHWFSPHRLVKWPFAVSDTSVQMGAGSLELLDSAGRSSFAWVAPQVSHQMAHQIGRSRWALAVGFEPEVRTPTATQGLGSRELESDTRLSGTLMLELLRTRKWVLSPFFSVDLGYRAGFSQIKIGQELRSASSDLRDSAKNKGISTEMAEDRLNKALEEAGPSETSTTAYSSGFGFAWGILPELGMMADVTRTFAQGWSMAVALSVREIGMGRQGSSGVGYRRVLHNSGYSEQIGINVQQMVERSVAFAIDAVWEERRDASGSALWGSYGTWITSRFYY